MPRGRILLKVFLGAAGAELFLSAAKAVPIETVSGCRGGGSY